jgi:hypothetical protein
VLRVEVIDALERPVPGFGAKTRQSGFQVPLDLGDLKKLPEKVRLRVLFEGAKRSEIRLSAIYAR